MSRAKRNRDKDRPNIVHRGQKATLNGKPVIADGKGNWVARTPGTYGNAQYIGKKSGTYKKGENRKSTPAKTKSIPADKRPADMRKGQVYGNDSKSHGRNWSNPHGQVSNKPSEGDRSTWGTKKTTPPKATAPKTTAPKKTAPKKPAATSTKKLTPMQQWAKAHPELAKKVKKGRSGAKELKIGRSTKPRNWLEKNYKPGKKK